MDIKKIKPLKFALYGIIFILFINICFALEIDSDDSYVVVAGENIVGSYVISDYKTNLVQKTNFEWISLEKNSDIKEKIVIGDKITENVVGIPYYIKVPEDADIGVYRTTILITDGQEEKYLNIKISVQNTIIKNIYQILIKSSIQKMIVILALIIGIMFLIYLIIKFGERF